MRRQDVATRSRLAAMFVAVWYTAFRQRPSFDVALARYEQQVTDLEANVEAEALMPGVPWESPRFKIPIAPIAFALVGGIAVGVPTVFSWPTTPTPGQYYYVTTTGSDTLGDGSSANPWATVQGAVNAIVARGLNNNMACDVAISVGPGTYWDTAVTVTPSANPTNGHKFIITARDGVGTVRLVGGHQLDTSGCTVHSGSIMKCPTSATFWTMWENGTRALSARTPNLVPDGSFPVTSEPFFQAAVGANDYTTLTYNPLDFDPSTWTLADVQVWGTESNGSGVRWFTGVTNVTNINTGTHVLTFPTQTKYKNGSRYYVMQNELALLDTAGEWYEDRTDAHGTCSGSHCLYYQPRTAPITGQEIVYPTTSDTIYFSGTDSSHPVHDWQLDGVTVEVSDFVQRYRYGNWGTGAPGDYDSALCVADPVGCGFVIQEQAESYARHGLIHIENAENITVSRVHAKNSGFACIYARGWVKTSTIRDSWVEHCGFDAIQFEGPVPGQGEQNTLNMVNNVKINNKGELLQHGAGIRFANSGHNNVMHAAISQGPRNGIFITDQSNVNTHTGWGWGNHIQQTSINSVCQDTGDVGAIGVFQVGSDAGNTAPLATNYFDQIIINNTACDPRQTDTAPNGVFFDNKSWNQNISNTNITNAAGKRNNDSGGHTETNVSWVGGFNSALMNTNTIGLSPGFPY